MLHRALTKEFIRRHGCGVMSGKIRPVHIANSLFRETLRVVGRTRDLKQVMIYTASDSTEEKRQRAIEQLLERSKERWGRLADNALTKEGALGRQVLPMLRTLLGTDGAVFGESIEQSSLTTPTGSLVTADPSDEHAGAFIKALWSTQTRDSDLSVSLLSLVQQIIDPERDLSTADDLTVLFAPLSEGMRERRPDEAASTCEDLLNFQVKGAAYDPILWELRQAADMLSIYERSVRPNVIATLERIVCLASLSIFFHLSTRGHRWAGFPRRPLLVQAFGKPESPVAKASTLSVQQLLEDAKRYLSVVIQSLLEATGEEADDWLKTSNYENIWQNLGKNAGLTLKPTEKKELEEFNRIISQYNLETEQSDILEDLIEKINERDSLVDYLRLLGMRTGLLYPQQRNYNKRVCLEDRVVEVLVAGTINVVNEPVEYQDFLDRLWQRFGIITGGRNEDELLLEQAGIPRVGSKYLRQNSEAFLRRLEEQGLAKRLADSKALVGLV